ncbi:MAG: hypothetical protein LBM97_02155 [Candidatus Nomurabacteria bacterium]|jgi:hypothetical protein|nr:hypothetical protein [Candidatus Nomurabacteria bacterium]
MSIEVKINEKKTGAEYIIGNGDFEALNRIKDAYKLKSTDDVIAFAIAVLDKANGNPIAITTPTGSLSKFMPAES